MVGFSALISTEARALPSHTRFIELSTNELTDHDDNIQTSLKVVLSIVSVFFLFASALERAFALL